MDVDDRMLSPRREEGSFYSEKLFIFISIRHKFLLLVILVAFCVRKL